MKKLIFLFLFPAAVLALDACRHETPATATLLLGFGGRAASAKSFTPEEIAISSIKIEGVGPGGTKIAATSSDFAPVELELAPGSWLITAKGLSAQGIVVASGFLELSLGPSESQTKDILLAPVAGDGAISLSWTLSGSVDGILGVEGSLRGSAGEVLPIEAPFSGSGAKPLLFEGLRNGSWKLELRLLRNGLALCGLADGVLVAAGMETKVSVMFKPPEASISLGLVMPDFSTLAFQVEPTERLASRGTGLVFRVPASEGLSWYAEGDLLPESGPELRYTPIGSGGGLRIDCVQGLSALPRSGSAEAKICEAQVLGPLAWGELVDKAQGSAAAQDAMRGLGDCRDLAWSSDGAFLAAAGKGSNFLSIFEAPAPGAVFVAGGLGGAAEPRLLSPSLLRFLPGGSLLAFSESEGAAYAVKGASLTSSLTDVGLAGVKDVAVLSDGSCAFVAASVAECVSLVVLDVVGRPIAVRSVASNSSSGLSSFSKPACLVLSPDEKLLAVGTTGDDAIYFFDRDVSTNALSLRSRVDKSAFRADAPLSDPCSLAFSPDASSLFVLSYYGKALLRLDRDGATGLFSVAAGVRSGLGGIAGFMTPKRLSLSPDGKLLAVAGGGAEDGLSVFEVDGGAKLFYLGTILPAAGYAVPKKPSALAFSPDGSILAVASDGNVSLFSVHRP